MTIPQGTELSGGDDSGIPRMVLQQDLETLLHVVSHDLRAPILTIQGFCQELSMVCDRLRSLCQDKPELNDVRQEITPVIAQEIPEAVHFIQAGAESISTVTAGLLRFIRLGQRELDWEAVDVNDLVGNVVTSMEFQMRNLGVVLHVGDLPRCMGDSVLIAQVFSDLLDNALKFLDPKRPGEITVAGKAEKGWSIYSITDNGIGIPEPQQAQVFHVLHRAGSHAGEGLGLAIVQRILDRHKGKIQLRSAPGRGSTFTVYLPRVIEDAEDPKAEGG